MSFIRSKKDFRNTIGRSSNKKSPELLICLFGTCLIGFPFPGLSEPSETDALARQIYDKELEVQQLNARLHLAAANPSFARARRTWLWDYGNALPTEGGLIGATALFFSHARAKKETAFVGDQREIVRADTQIKGRDVAATIDPQIVGQCIGAAGSCFELSLDCYRPWRLRRQHLDRHSITKRMLELKHDIDDLQRRFEAQSNEPSLVAEGKFLKELRNKSFVEFGLFEESAARIATGAVIEDGVSLTRNTVGCVGNAMNVEALLTDNKRLNGDGMILNLISASMVTLRPFVSNIASILSKDKNERRIEKNFPELSHVETEVDLKHSFDALEKSTDGVAVRADQAKRIALYQRQLQVSREDDSLDKSERRELKQIALRRYRESLYGPTKGTQSILGMVVHFRKLNDPTAENSLSGAANVTYVSGQLFNIFELTRERIVDEAAHGNLKREKMLPEMRIARNLSALHSIQEDLHK